MSLRRIRAALERHAPHRDADEELLELARQMAAVYSEAELREILVGLERSERLTEDELWRLLAHPGEGLAA